MRYVLPGEREQRVTAVLRGVERQHQNQKTDAGAGEVKILERVLGACAHAAVTDADQRQEINSDEAKLRRAKRDVAHEPPSASSSSLGQVRNAAQAARQEIRNETPVLTATQSGMPSTRGCSPPSAQYQGTAAMKSSAKPSASSRGRGDVFGLGSGIRAAAECPAGGSGCNPICAGIENGLRFGGGTASCPPFTARVCRVVASGVIAQLVERRVRNAKVCSSILHGSTIPFNPFCKG